MGKKVILAIVILCSLSTLWCGEGLSPDYEVSKRREKVMSYWIVRGNSMLDRERARARMRSILAMQIRGSNFSYDKESGQFKLINETTVTGSVSEPSITLKGGNELFILSTTDDIEEVRGEGVILREISLNEKEVDRLLKSMIKQAVIEAAKGGRFNYNRLSGKVYVSGFKVKYKRFRNIFQASARISVIFLEGE